ncbi:F-box/FBD/LRR-repeat protein At1g13570-like isoform X1 [Pyrus communis]|uniref:F-box/FBD/LRR-repeat protein At1g13570-like isoform X1 n=1 Tax=Pyrus communis TaxID=23211 RepID=UPI0035C1D3A0
MELDRISNLPSDAIDRIFSCLPIKEAVKTSVLSSKWSYKTALLTHLVFDNQCFSTQKHITFQNIVDQVLLLHIGPIHSLRFSLIRPLAAAALDRWILHLSRNSIKELILEFWEIDVCYNLPSCLFSCQDLVCLEIRNCLLKPPPTFKGFRSLKSLSIGMVTMAQGVFDNLIVSCPLLERLIVSLCDGFTHLNVDAPNLQYFAFGGSFETVNLENTLNLVEVDIDFCDEDLRWVSHSSSHLVKFLDRLPCIQRLTIQSSFLEYLAVGALPQKLPQPCLYLRFLSITIDFRHLNEVLTVQCLLRSSPALQVLEVLASGYGMAAVQEVKSWFDDNQNFQFSQLKRVKITGLSDSKTQLDFIRSLLLTSPVLERMTVNPSSVNACSKLVKELLQFRRASAHAEIIYLGP